MFFCFLGGNQSQIVPHYWGLSLVFQQSSCQFRLWYCTPQTRELHIQKKMQISEEEKKWMRVPIPSWVPTLQNSWVQVALSCIPYWLAGKMRGWMRSSSPESPAAIKLKGRYHCSPADIPQGSTFSPPVRWQKMSSFLSFSSTFIYLIYRKSC